jgi:restriction system protein
VLLDQVSQIIAAKVADDPSLLRRMTPRAFEEFISKLFLTFGYRVELTKRTRDNGYDVVALKKYRDGQHKLLIEAKRYARSRPVGVAVVRQLLQVRDEERATRVILATTSRFTKGARELCRKHEYELDLRDHDDLIAWAREASGLLHRRDADTLIVRPRRRPVRRGQ